MNRTAWFTAGLWTNAVVLAALVLIQLNRREFPEFLPAAMGQPVQPIAGGAGLFLMPAQFSSNTWGCYVMDVDSQTLCAYQFLPGEKQLRLVAARNFRFDRRLGNYNTSPAPLDVKDLVDKEAQTNRVGEPPN
jgi:hypothetical protein